METTTKPKKPKKLRNRTAGGHQWFPVSPILPGTGPKGCDHRPQNKLSYPHFPKKNNDGFPEKTKNGGFPGRRTKRVVPSQPQKAPWHRNAWLKSSQQAASQQRRQKRSTHTTEPMASAWRKRRRPGASAFSCFFSGRRGGAWRYLCFSGFFCSAYDTSSSHPVEIDSRCPPFWLPAFVGLEPGGVSAFSFLFGSLLPIHRWFGAGMCCFPLVFVRQVLFSCGFVPRRKRQSSIVFVFRVRHPPCPICCPENKQTYAQ